MVVTLGQQYNIGEKLTVILYTYKHIIAMEVQINGCRRGTREESRK